MSEDGTRNAPVRFTWARRLVVTNVLLWGLWAILEWPEQPGQPLWDAIHAPERVVCFDCPRYVFLNRGVGSPLLVVGLGNLLARMNTLPLEAATILYDRSFTRRVREVNPLLFGLLSSLQWALVGYFAANWLERLHRRWGRGKAAIAG